MMMMMMYGEIKKREREKETQNFVRFFGSFIIFAYNKKGGNFFFRIFLIFGRMCFIKGQTIFNN